MAGDRDFRKLESSVQAELRRRAVALVDCGKTRQEAAAAVGVNRRFVGEWVKARDEGGDRALDGGKRGRRPGEQLALKDRDAARIRRRIADKCPDQLKLPFALWTREAVAELIERETGIRLSRQAVSVYLKRWAHGTAPDEAATERREPDIKQWLKTGYPALAKRQRPRKPRSSGPMRPGLRTSQLWPQLRAERQDADHQTSGCALLAEHDFEPDEPRQAQVHGLRWCLERRHLSALPQASREGRAAKDLPCRRQSAPPSRQDRRSIGRSDLDKIELVYLPPYAPEHNPDEFVNNDVKQAMARRQAPKDKAELKKGLTSYMRGLQKRPAKIRAFFQAPTVRYAA